jgi:ubiquinone/menaquinone biosynthesis C-methylase UbiE
MFGAFLKRFRRKPATTFWQVTGACATFGVAATDNDARKWLRAHVGLPLDTFFFNFQHAERKRKLFESIRAGERNHVLELGVGVGGNFGFLPEGVLYTGVDGNRFLDAHIRESAARAGVPPSSLTMHYTDVHAYLAGLESNSQANIVCTDLLSSSVDPRHTAQEIYRVLKPRGKLYFVEHSHSSWWHPQRVVQLLAWPLHMLTRDIYGCHGLEAVAEAGFGKVHMEQWPLGSHIAENKEDRKGITRVRLDPEKHTVSGLRGWLRAPLVAGVALKTTSSASPGSAGLPKPTSTAALSMFNTPITMDTMNRTLNQKKKEE